MAILPLHLLSALFAGLLVYELTHLIAPKMQRRLTTRANARARLFAVMILATVIIGGLTAVVFGAIHFFRSDAGSIPALLERLAKIIDDSRGMVPPSIADKLPADIDDLRELMSGWLRDNKQQVQGMATSAGKTVLHLFLGMVIGGIIALRTVERVRPDGPLSHALTERAVRLGESFRRVVFAQVRISALNTIFTTIYLGAVLPTFGVHLPLLPTLIGITFFAGLLPVVGNLISNALIVTVSLSYSLPVALASLGFLVIIHKLEYFLNARIVGTQIHASAWELLIAMVAMETVFGLPGLVAAPVYYAYLKRELEDRDLL